jgi:hypothetical protein
MVFRIMLILSLVPIISKGQEVEVEEFKHNRASIVLGHTHIPKGVPAVPDGGSVIVASWGLNYEYWFNRKWAIGLHNDMEIATYIIEDANGNIIERSRPIIVSLVGVYNVWQGLEIIAGLGREFEEHENYWVYRFGLEYEIEIGNNWDLAPALVFDAKENLYDSWTIGIVIGKRF